MFDIADRILLSLRQWHILLLGYSLVAFVAVLDFLTGTEVSFSVFYLIPIALVAWYGRTAISYLTCVLSSAVWLAVDHASGEGYSHALIPYWNAVVRLGFFIITAHLLCSLKVSLLREQNLARVDELTGLFNVRAFRNVSTQLILLSRRHNHPFALAFIDVDNFKRLNDSLGHSEGDQALRMVGETLRKTVRSTDVLGRLGGDEFAVLLPETGSVAAESVLNKVRDQLQKQTLAQWPINFSIGVAVFTSPPLHYDQAIHIADQLMYRVKSGGKGRTEIEEFQSEELLFT